MAVMAVDHPLAGRRSISTLEVDRWVLMTNFAPVQVLDVILPPTNVDGTPIPRVRVETSISTMAEPAHDPRYRLSMVVAAAMDNRYSRSSSP
ncbi:hypothetical protein ACU61A_33830 [Pseudonocardia sichuanensis]